MVDMLLLNCHGKTTLFLYIVYMVEIQIEKTSSDPYVQRYTQLYPIFSWVILTV